MGYEEDFDAGTGGGGNGAYVCALTITAPAFELHSGGGPALAAAPAGLASTAALGGGSVLGSDGGVSGPGAALGSEVPSLLEIARAVNPLNGQGNCTHITEAVVARLHGTDPTAVAPDLPPRTLRELAAIHNTTVGPCAGFQEAFNTVREGGEGTTALLFILPLVAGQIGHVVTLTNRDGTPTIIEGQNWGPRQPAEVITSLARAERRYGDPAAVRLAIGMVPSPRTDTA